MRAAAERVQQILGELGLVAEVTEFAEPTRTAAEAALRVGCTPAQIAKSLIFRAQPSNRPILVIASGAHRVSESAVESALGEKIARADPEFVRATTGFAIGGVPPVGHRVPPVTFIDEALLKFDAIWVAAGTPFAVVRLTPDELLRLTGGQVARLAS